MTKKMTSKDKKLPAVLLIVDSASKFSFSKPIIRIGRLPENDLVINHPSVSREHVEIRYQEDRFELIDLDSTGGTYVLLKAVIFHVETSRPTPYNLGL